MPEAGNSNGELRTLKPADVGRVIAISSARGGAGKSVLSVNIAASLAIAGKKVAIVDADLNAPSILGMLGVEPRRRFGPSEELEPISGPLGIRVVASNMLADGEPPAFSFMEDETTASAAISNGSRTVELDHRMTLRRLLGAGFGPIDIMLIDSACGLSSLYRLAAMVELSGVMLVTHPSETAVHATREAIDTISHAGVEVIGLVENMVGFNCNSCHAVRPLFPQGDLTAVAKSAGVPILGRLPFDPRMADCCERGSLFVREYADTPLAKQFAAMAKALERDISAQTSAPSDPPAHS